MADRVINIEARFTTDVSNLQGGLQSVQGLLKNLKIPNLSTTKLSSQFEVLNEKLKRYKELAEKADTGRVTKGEFNEMKKLGGEIDTLYKNMIKEAGQVGSKITDITGKVNDLKKSIANAEAEMAKLNRGTLASATKENWKGLRQGAVYLKQGKEIDPFERLGTMSSSKQYQQLYSNFMGQVNVGNWKEASSILDSLLAKGSKLQGFRTQFEKTFGKEFTESRLKSFSASLKNILEEAAKIEAPEGIKKFAKEIEKTQAQIQKLVGEGSLSEAAVLIGDLQEKLAGSKSSWESTAQAMATFGKNSVDTAKQIEQLAQRVEYFFGLQNQIQLFKRLVRSAFNTIQELDKTMTETAVVTKFSVGDMWQQLPEYTAEAKKLGATINDLYQANTLYYQQGLNQTQAMQLGVETLKMARIAGLDAAAATDAMTAALRGFNMELNDTSAQRVNDVYSKLAANTASNVEEISTAVEKTASLAYSAGMDLEQTASFLAQIIETTREAPETAGTALKTIIARFGEVKKLHGEGLITGVDEEGQEIDVNRVDEALKSAGINLRDFIAGNESLADVFLKLSQRWNTLTLEQQRYIATQSAGARQQSRFIAMMQNTARTQELLGYAYDSEGASQVQFEKTLEGLEAKLNKFKDEWQQFTMGIANSEIVKFSVDALTLLVKIINQLLTTTEKAVSYISPGIGKLTKSLVSLAAVIFGLKKSGTVIKKGINFFGETLLEGVRKKADRKSNDAGEIEEARETGIEIGKAKEEGKREGEQLAREASKPVQDVKETIEAREAGERVGAARAEAEAEARKVIDEAYESGQILGDAKYAALAGEAAGKAQATAKITAEELLEKIDKAKDRAEVIAYA